MKLAEVLASSQLKVLSLSILGSIFKHTDPTQAEKMFTTAYKISRKGGVKEVTETIAWALAELCRLKGDEAGREVYLKEIGDKRF